MISPVHERWGRCARRILAALVATVLAALPACGGDDTTTATTVPAPTTTTAGDDDPWAVPATIDEPYVQRILDELARIEGEVTRELVREQGITERLIVLLAAIYAPEEVGDQLELVQLEIERGLESYADDPGNPEMTLTDLISSDIGCVHGVVERDFSNYFSEAEEDEAPIPEYITLVRASGDPNLEKNRTGWLILEVIFRPDGTQPENPCT